MRKTWIFLSLLISVVLIVNVIRFWPDGKLHLTFCDVGQGDASYIRFPNQQDLLIDGGPDRKVLDCLGQAMPFFDRHIDVVMLTHPQADHLNGLIPILERYGVGYFITSPIGNETEGYKTLLRVLREKKVVVHNLYSGAKIRFGASQADILWPKRQWVADHVDSRTNLSLRSNVLGVSTQEDLNHFSLITRISYGSMDALFTGDSDRVVDQELANDYSFMPSDGVVEILKVPHHGSKTGMLEDFIAKLHSQLAVISVGAKNRYGHPTQEALNLLSRLGLKVLRTDRNGTVEVVSDGKTWVVSGRR